jgi:tetratricopeptide (TPR) repeat protein
MASRAIEGGDYARAERLALQASRLLEVAGAREDSWLVVALNTLGMAHKYQGNYLEGRRAYLGALALTRRRDDDPQALAALLHNLGGLEHARGRHARAEPFARRALDLRSRLLGTEHPDVARDLAALAAIVDGRRRHEEAESMHRRAIEILRRHLGVDHRDVAAALVNLAACLHAQGRDVEAERVAERAVRSSVVGFGAGHPHSRLAAANLAAIRGGKA